MAESLPPKNAWLVEMLRATCFHRLGPQKGDTTYWNDVTGLQPEVKAVRLREGGYEESGSFGNGYLTHRGDPLRFDWLLSAAPSEQPTGTFQVIGNLDETLPGFVSLVEKWLSMSPDLYRIAFGAVVLQPVADRAEGYRLLDRYLHDVKMDPEGSSDFNFQINRYRNSAELGGLKINRLTRWSVARVHQMMVMAGVQGVEITHSGGETSAARIEIDFNTDAGHTDFFDNKAAVWNVLVKMGIEVIERGDIK